MSTKSRSRLMSSLCTGFTSLLYSSPRTTIFWRSRLDKSNILLYKVLLHHRLPQDLSGPNQGSMVVECCTICSIYMTHLDTVGVHPVTLPKDTGTVDPNNYHSTLVLEEEVSFAGFICLPACIQYLDPPDT